ncbi:glutathione binding-like protein [Rhizobium leguminosarum]|uniref:glutathione binding-like protein n=1 Tax=Rhizobium leguminosarum TaxID=384 RepID=UPI001FE22B07|nr:glutathione binding-like protein [Rhizobium leguminosarum]
MVVKLFYAPGACSLASHICLIEGKAQFEAERVDLKTKITASGGDFRAVTAKGYVPALMLDSGEVVTENVAVLSYLAGELPALGVSGEFGRIRLIEALAYLSTEVHKRFESLFSGADPKEQSGASASITYRLRYLADRMREEYLFGDQPSVADFYLFVMMRWASMFGVAIPTPLYGLYKRLLARPSVQTALESEGLAIS